VSSSITINSNIPSLCAQRRLGESTQKLLSTYAHLSSGLRITKASDDAAGLALSESLNADARVFNEGMRNFNEAISLSNVSEGALRELASINTRQLELATQAANGVLSTAQRHALDEEANALVDEYNRIVQSTQFNDIQCSTTACKN
jgi:flagellin